MRDVLFAAKRGEDVARQIVTCFGDGRCIRFVCIIRRIFAARSSEVEFADNEAESEVVNHGNYKTYRNYQPPCRAVRNNTEQDIVDKSAGERHPDFNIQDVHGHKGQTCEHSMYRKQQRCNEQEGEFQRLSNPCEEGSERCRYH
ncbi:hypothetical protein D3C81_1883800 [compost metagenome]